jgi:hypothetical protein
LEEVSLNVELQALNEAGGQFWKRRQMLFEKADEWAVDLAYRRLQRADIVADRLNLTGAARFHFQKSFDHYVIDIMEAESRSRSSLARRGGHARKGDRLNNCINELAKRNPSISHREVEFKIRKMITDEPWVLSMNEFKIEFENWDGKIKSAKISGLKDRISRAKLNNRPSKRKKNRA